MVEMADLLQLVVDEGVSDLHIEVGAPPVVRLHGNMTPLDLPPLTAEDTERLVKSFASELHIQKIQEVGSVDFGFAFGDQARFRVSAFKQKNCYGTILRQIPNTLLTFEQLGLPDAVKNLLYRPRGLVLVTGPTGSGKSTTLYAFLKEVNNNSVNIVTVEDPVEYTMSGINQTQVNVKANMTFASALRSILRQDPDIIMIGEIRDEETAQIAVRAAITGHLVFSTLHTNDAPGAVTRLEDMGVADYLIADALVGVIAQRLVKRLCPACKKKGKTTAKEMEILGIAEPVTIARPRGCQFCNNTGYKGRIAVHEIMHVNEELRNAIAREKSVDKMRELARNNGMVPLWNTCRDYVLKGVTSIQELMTLDMN